MPEYDVILAEMEDLIVGDYAEMFYTDSSEEMYQEGQMDPSGFIMQLYMEAYPSLQERMLPTWPSHCFDLLYDFTDALWEYSTDCAIWAALHEAVEGEVEMILGLGRAWQMLLHRTNEELGIDAVYTWPGILAFLQVFKEYVEDANEEFNFNFQ